MKKEMTLIINIILTYKHFLLLVPLYNALLQCDAAVTYSDLP